MDGKNSTIGKYSSLICIEPVRLIVKKTLSILLSQSFVLLSILACVTLNKPLEAAMPKPPAEIAGEIITLKEFKEEDFKALHNMLSPIVRKNLELPDEMTLEDTINFLKSRQEKAVKGELFVYSIFDNKDKKVIGSIEVRNKEDESSPGLVGCWINENYWGGGRYMEALKLLAEVYFALYPDIKSITARIELWNQRSYKAAIKFGCKLVGYLKDKNENPTQYIVEYSKPKILE